MKKSDIEKSLKRFLKRKVSYSLALLITFMISGEISVGIGITDSEIAETKNDILSKIQREREEIERMLAENNSKIKELQLDSKYLLKEADFYSKPTAPASAVTIIGGFKNADSVGKNWYGSVRRDTKMDSMRKKFNEVFESEAQGDKGSLLNAAQYTHYGKYGGYLSTGWINSSEAYNKNTNVYDAESTLFILPVVKAPVVMEPTVPSVSISVPTAPVVIPVTSPSMVSITVTAPTVTAPSVITPTVVLPTAPVQPGDITVAVNEPSINVSIGAINVTGPEALTIPALAIPGLSITVSPNLPPRVDDPNPTVTVPTAPPVPNFTAFTRGRGDWLGGFSFIAGRNTWDRNIMAWEQGTGHPRLIAINSQPMFNGVGNLSGVSKAGSVITATSIGGVVTNSYTNIISSASASGGKPTDKYGSYPHTQTSPGSIGSMTAGVAVSATDNGTLPAANYLPPGINAVWHPTNPNAIRYQQTWIFQGGPKVSNMTIKIGGDSGYTSAIFAQVANIEMSNVDIEQKGGTIVGQISTRGAYKVDFSNVNINISGDRNSILTTQVFPNAHVYWQSTDGRGSSAWGVSYDDSIASSTAVDFGGTQLTSSRSRNTIFYVAPADMHRWNGYSQMVPLPNTTTPNVYDVNSRKYNIFAPTFGNINIKNTGGKVQYTGSDNVGIWIASYVPDRTKWATTSLAPHLDLGTILLQGDKNVGYYLAGITGVGEHRANLNGIFQGTINVDAKIGTDLDGSGGNIQVGTGNYGSGDAKKSENNVAIYVASGQRTGLNYIVPGQSGGSYLEYFPATLGFKVNTALYPDLVGIANNSEIGFPFLSADPIKNLKLTNFKVEFGKYSKAGIGMMVKNGSVVEVNTGTTINDNAGSGTDRATDSIMFYAEGVWLNPRKLLTTGTYDKEAYGRGESQTGKKYISDYNSTISVADNIVMSSNESIALFSKNGGKISAKNVTMNGHSAKAVFAYGTMNYTNIIGSNKADSGVQPDTTLTVANITAKTNGGTVTTTNTNIGAAAVSGEGITKGTGKTIVTVTGNIDVAGLGAFARGDKATVNINGNSSAITSGENGALVAKEGGILNFGGGVIKHGVENKLAFFSEKDGVQVSTIKFTGATTIEISKGVVFYGDTADYSSGSKLPGETGRYQGMGNVTIKLMDNGVNLGVFKDINVTWDGSTAYQNGLSTIFNTQPIVTNGKWYKSSLDGGQMIVQANVNRDSISSGAIIGDGFNDIIMERKKVIVDSGYTISSSLGNGMLIGSNSKAVTNNESGYTISGMLDISDTAGSTTAAYVSFGHIDIKNIGTVKVGKGIAAYGVNGSKIVNAGLVEVIASDSTNKGIGIAGMVRNIGGTAETYGTDTGLFPALNLVEIINRGTITVNGTHGIGIYGANNVAGSLRGRVLITNEKPIHLGDYGTGIAIKSNGTHGGTINLKNSVGDDILVGKEGIGIYGEDSTINFDGNYTVSIKDNGIGLHLTGTSSTTKTSASDKLIVDYKGASGTGNTAIGMAFKGTTAAHSLSNSLNIDVINTNGAETVVGIYAAGAGTLTNSGAIKSESLGSYGIISDKVNIVNTGLITVGDSTATADGAVGIYAENASVTTKGKDIIIQGDGDSTLGVHPIGIYAKSTSGGTGGIITVNADPTAMAVDGKAGIGVYIEDINGNVLELRNNSNINLADSSNTAERRYAIFMTNAKNTGNITTGIINVGENNIGIYAKDSTLTNTGTINVTHIGVGTENIGVHNVTDNGNFTFKNSGTFNVNGISNIGISAKTTGTHSGLVELSGGTIGVTASSMANGNIPLGVYASGNNLSVSSLIASNFTVSPNGVGIYMEGDNTSSTSGLMNFSLSSHTGGKMGIGGYYKNGAYAGIGTVTLNSTSTALDSSGDPVRPIGLYYGVGSTQNATNIVVSAGSDKIIGMYGSNLGTFANSGNITLNAESIGAYFINTDMTNTGNIAVTTTGQKGYGMYLKGGISSTAGNINAGGANSVGYILTGAGAKLTNTGNISSDAAASIGIYAESGAEFVNSSILNSTLAGATGSIGAFAKGATLTNTGTVTSEYMGLYGKDGSTINHSGILNINSGVGMLADSGNSAINMTGGTVSGTTAGIAGAVGKNTGKVTLNGTNISLGATSTGIILDSGTADLIMGNITTGAGGTGVYAESSSINMTAYNGTFTLGSKGVGIYAEDTTVSAGTLNVTYTDPTDKGVGIYYKNSSPAINRVEINHTGDNLVNIYSDSTNLTNMAAQTVQNDGIGIFASGGTLNNQGTLTLTGTDTVGIYLDGTSQLTGVGNISGSAVTSGNKIGVYVNSGNITGNGTYNFGVNGGVGIYLQNGTVSYTGQLNVTGASTVSNRTIGVFNDIGVTGNLNNGINVTGADAIGTYLSNGSNITYGGALSITATSTTAGRGIGAYLDTGSTFTLGATGSVNIGGTENIGFYVNNGASLNVTGGTVTNTADGIFAYLDGGSLHFTSGSPLNINYTNVIVSGGTLLNDGTITVGSSGLQGDNSAIITNSGTGVINGSTVNAKALVGTTNAVITNAGKINLTGDTSIGIYVEQGAVGTSTGSVSVKDKSAAYYVGTGGTLNISGTGSVGEDSSLMFGAGGTLNYTGSNIVTGYKQTILTLSDVSSVANFNGREITTGAKGTGIVLTGTGDISSVQNLAKLNVSGDSVGIYMNNTVALNTGIAINLTGAEAIGIFTIKNGDINYTGNMTSTVAKVKGIINTGSGNSENSGNIVLTGASSIGMYGENGTPMTNHSNITVGDGAYSGLTLQSAVGIYGKNVASILNNGTVKVGKDAVGIYGENTSVVNSNNIISTGEKSTGIYGLGGNATNNGTITLGDSSNGIFVKNGTLISNTGNITVGKKNSAGIYGAGTTNISHLSGTITTGVESTGIASESGNINVATGAQINTGTDSTSVYSASGNGVSNTILNLKAHSIGLYTKSGTMINNGSITTGTSTVIPGTTKISVAMAAESGKITNNKDIFVPHKYGVGMVANNIGHAINSATGTIRVDGDLSYGMQATKKSLLENYGTIIVNGDQSRGMAATDSSKVVNYGDIFVNGSKSEGIYIDYNATAENYGDIYVTSADGTGIYIGSGGNMLNEGRIHLSGGATDKYINGSGTLTNVGDITIDGAKASIDGVTITNTGTITVNGTLDFNNVVLGSTAGHVGTINANSFNKGQFLVLPNATQGTNHNQYVVQYLKGISNVPNNGSITAISHSVSFLADIQKDATDPNLVRVVMVKIPYEKLLTGTEAIEFGKGLDEIYAGATDKGLAMFDALDMISDKDELGSTFDMELRGNVYANIQTRMLDISDVFATSYNNLKENTLYSKETLKIGAIMTGGETKDKNAGVEDYESKSLGTMLLKERDYIKYGRASNWSLGFAQTKFDFDYGSDETVYSLNLGLGYEDYIKDSRNLKYHTRGEIGINYHETERKIHLSSGTYENTGKYWSGIVEWKNMLRYEVPITDERINLGVFGTFNLGYGKFEDFKEKGDGIYLDVKSEDMYVVRPGVGADVALNKYMKEGKISLIGKATAEYELGKVYDGANRAKIKGTDAGYYKLEEPKEVKGIFKVGAELKYQTKEGHSIGVEITRQEGSVDSTKYGVNLMYRF